MGGIAMAAAGAREKCRVSQLPESSGSPSRSAAEREPATGPAERRSPPSASVGAAWLALLAVLGAAFATLPSLHAQQGPVFEAETALMEVEVRVTDGKGRPIADLRKEEFELLENGVPQTISTFEFVRQAGRTPSPAEPAASPPGTGIGRDPAAKELARSTFLYIATRGRREDRLRIYNAVRTFIDEHLVPGMLVSIEGSPFTSRRSELDQRLDEMLARSGRLGGASFIDTLAVDLAREDIQYSESLESLIDETNDEFAEELEEIADRSALYRRIRMLEYIDLIRALSVYPGRKIVVLFSTGLPVDEDNIDIMEMLEDEATRRRVRFYVSDVSGLTATPPGGDAEAGVDFNSLFGDPTNNRFATQAQQRQDSQDGLFELARRTGGRAVLNSNDFGEVFDVVLRESSDYYLVGYYPREPEQRGRHRRVRVRVLREGVHVTHQRGYYEERPFDRMSRSEKNLILYEALNFDTPYADLPLRADFEFFHDSRGGPTLVYAVGLHSRDIPSKQGRDSTTVKLTVIAQAKPKRGPDERPSPSVLDERRFEMQLDSAAFDRLADDPNSWLHYGSQMPLKPGDYDWKVVVRDDLSGALGSYQTTLRVPQPKPQVSASSLLLTSRIEDVGNAGKRRTSTKGPENVLEVDGSRFYAAAVKSFRKGDAIYLLYDIYNPSDESQADLIAPKLALYRGREPIKQIPVSGHQTVAQPDASRIRYLAALETSGLPAGTYIIAAMVDTQPTQHSAIFRGFRIVAPAPGPAESAAAN